ncbi:MAG: D-2-hydroxyacid dehydrogenase [Oscillospiraceae bacterium]|nr:D-2-hydroxyacid dehydrogenase [Oscillospiraceae bacterium]MBQ5417837.1 D-2-hydroxyacid dehydrogenase [Oscillospiraceae bacterium]
MKIAILEEKTVTNDSEVSFDGIRALGECVCYPLTPQEKLLEHLGDAEAAIINKTVFTRETIGKCPHLKYIGLCATGYNNVDTAAAAEAGITVTNCPAYSTDAVAQQVFAYILHFMNRTAQYDRDVHDGGWVRSDTFSYFPFPTYELAGMKLGIIGYGSIGKRVADIALAFGMEVFVSTRTPQKDDRVQFIGTDDIFSVCDIITLHCPLTPETKELVNMARLSRCRKNAIIINTSRGGAVNEYALASALHDHIIAGAAVDVISEEPMKADNPLLTAPNCVITPHISWAPLQTRKRLLKIAEDNLRAYINGSPVNKVN